MQMAIGLTEETGVSLANPGRKAAFPKTRAGRREGCTELREVAMVGICCSAPKCTHCSLVLLHDSILKTDFKRGRAGSRQLNPLTAAIHCPEYNFWLRNT